MKRKLARVVNDKMTVMSDIKRRGLESDCVLASLLALLTVIHATTVQPQSLRRTSFHDQSTMESLWFKFLLIMLTSGEFKYLYVIFWCACIIHSPKVPHDK